MLLVQQECAGKKMKTTLNAFMDSRKRSASCKSLPNVNEERSLENHLILTSSMRLYSSPIQMENYDFLNDGKLQFISWLHKKEKFDLTKIAMSNTRHNDTKGSILSSLI